MAILADGPMTNLHESGVRAISASLRWYSPALIAAVALSCTSTRNTQPAASGQNAAPTTSSSAENVAAVPDTPGPFEGAKFFVNPDYVAKLTAAAKADKANADLIRKVATFPTAVWLDSIASVANVSKTLDAAEKQVGSDGQPVVATFVVYDLPNRDCSAKASAGELEVGKGGEEKYKSEF
ncbi:MAG TPA: glycoside hydrolase family 6 protein, partial [Polyangiaceae bacterium]|nr:glycoside hydrolase family 6 protein [Polyangiaceae bacterium]